MDKTTDDELPAAEAGSEAEPSGGGVFRKIAARRSSFAIYFVVITGLVWLASVGMIYVTPSEYAGTTLIEFKLPPGDDNETVDYEREFEILQSARVLDLVVQKLGLDRKWDMTPYEAMQTLQAACEFESVAEFRMARIMAYRTEAALAAQIADAVAEAYSERKVREVQKNAAEYGGWTENVITLLEDRTEKARVKHLDILEQYRSFAIEGSPIVIFNEKAIDPRTISNEEELSAYIASRRQMVVVEESAADYSRSQAQLEQFQRDLLEVRIRQRYTPIAIHEQAVIATLPARPDVEKEMWLATRKAVLFGAVGALLGVLLLPSRLKAKARPQSGSIDRPATSPPDTPIEESNY